MKIFERVMLGLMVVLMPITLAIGIYRNFNGKEDINYVRTLTEWIETYPIEDVNEYRDFFVQLKDEWDEVNSQSFPNDDFIDRIEDDVSSSGTSKAAFSIVKFIKGLFTGEIGNTLQKIWMFFRLAFNTIYFLIKQLILTAIWVFNLPLMLF